MATDEETGGTVERKRTWTDAIQSYVRSAVPFIAIFLVVMTLLDMEELKDTETSHQKNDFLRKQFDDSHKREFGDHQQYVEAVGQLGDAYDGSEQFDYPPPPAPLAPGVPSVEQLLRTVILPEKPEGIANDTTPPPPLSEVELRTRLSAQLEKATAPSLHATGLNRSEWQVIDHVERRRQEALAWPPPPPEAPYAPNYPPLSSTFKVNDFDPDADMLKSVRAFAGLLPVSSGRTCVSKDHGSALNLNQAGDLGWLRTKPGKRGVRGVMEAAAGARNFAQSYLGRGCLFQTADCGKRKGGGAVTARRITAKML
ncbi:hypothetical protein CYMTET_10368, partial [Cymbomonas tetramitiformis]